MFLVKNQFDKPKAIAIAKVRQIGKLPNGTLRMENTGTPFCLG